MPEMNARLRSGLRFAAIAVAAGFLIYGFSPLVRKGAGHSALAIDLPMLGGGNWSLAAQRGNVVLVNFWATWCPPCRMETPGLVELYRRYEDRGLRVAGISMDDDAQQAVPQFVSEYHIPYPMLIPGNDFPLGDRIESLPTSFLIDRQGHIARTYVGAVDEETLAHDVEQLLEKQP
jgi:cytochrome c biogenesis protein CcmG/thiol:disulfide interchange protein DsbE